MRIIFFLFLVCVSSNSFSELKAMTENELALTDGQAFIGLDQYNQDGLDFTRINMGVDIEIVMNADEMVFGEYARAGETQTADIRFNNYAMGYIDQNGTVRPFQMTDPFFEFAYDRSNGTDDFVGFRFGFGESMGMMSMDAKSLTGNVDVVISGDFTYHVDLGFLGSFDLPLQASGASALVDDNGDPDPIRATSIGMANGTTFNIEFLGLDIPATVTNCQLGGQNLCFPLNTFESMLIGGEDSNGDLIPIEGLFQSFQTRNINWGNAAAGETQVATTSGAFFNVPRGSVNITPDEAAAGTPRLATEFIDRDVGRFEHPDYRNGNVGYPQ
ncbi:MAG: hypothetical protein V7785_20630 [Bermanella sp.]